MTIQTGNKRILIIYIMSLYVAGVSDCLHVTNCMCFIYVHVRVYVRMCRCMCICTLVNVYVYVCVVCVGVCIWRCMCVNRM